MILIIVDDKLVTKYRLFVLPARYYNMIALWFEQV